MHTQAEYAIAIWNLENIIFKLLWFLYSTESYMHKSAQIVTACKYPVAFNDCHRSMTSM